MKIYNASGTEIVDVLPDDSSHRYRAVMGDDNLTLKYSLAEHIELPLGAYVTFQGKNYVLKRPENLKMRHTRAFEYTVIFDSPQSDSKIWKFRNPIDGRLKFPLVATPKEHLQMFVDNMNRRDSGWSIGYCLDGEEKLVSYDHDYCWEALGKIAETFNTEFEISGKTVYLRRVEYNRSAPLQLSYGKGNGFRSGIGRSNSGDKPPVEILFVQGGTDNIDRSKYGSSELRLPRSQTIRFDGSKFEGETGFDSSNARSYVTDADGLSIRRSDRALSSQAEESIDCSHIYPKRIGTVSGVVTVDADKNLYDFIDSSIPASLNYEDCLIAGETMTVEFQTGELAGHGAFEVKYYHNAVEDRETGNMKAARRFEIVPKEEDGYIMPSGSFKPAVNDRYAVFGCQLPAAYICDNTTKTGAEWDMFREGVRYMYDNEEALFSFTGAIDGLWSKQQWSYVGQRIIIGGYVSFTDARFQDQPVLVRIIGVKDFINKPHSPEVELSNKTVSAGFSTKINQIEAQEVVNADNIRKAMNFTKRRWRDAKETIAMIEEGLFENFTESITPLTVQTMSMLVGDESLQYRFVASKANPVEVSHTFTYNEATRKFSTAAGVIQHLTLGIDQVKPSHDSSEYKYWSVSAFESEYLRDPTKKYYLYIKANRSSESAIFMLSETAYAMDADSSYYYFLVGVLNSEYEGTRSFASLYGFTEILPGRITTDKIVSTSGTTYFDLVAGEIGGNIKIKSGSSGYDNLSDKPDLSVYAYESELSVNAQWISGLVQRVSTVEGTISSAGWITQADGNTWWAAKTLEDGDTIISYINQNATTTTINSSRIDLVGAVTFSMFSSGLQDVINAKTDSSSLGSLAWLNSVDWSNLGGTLQGTISGKADSSSLGTLATLNSIAWGNLDSGVQGTINGKLTSVSWNDLQTAVQNTINGKLSSVSWSDLTSAVQNVINGKLTSVAWDDLQQSLKNTINAKVSSSSLGNLAYVDEVTAALLGTTIVTGGYLNSNYIDVNHISATSGTIGGWSIGQNGLTATTSGGYFICGDNSTHFLRINYSGAFLSIRNDSDKSASYDTAVSISAYGNNATGLDIIAQAGDNSIAINCYGDVRYNVRSGESFRISGDGFFAPACAFKSSSFTLPTSNVPTGSVYFVKGSNVTVSTSGNRIKASDSSTTTSSYTQGADSAIYVYDGYYWNHFRCD